MENKKLKHEFFTELILPAQSAENANPFPLEAFPEPVQAIIKALHECLNYPIEFTGSSMLFTISIAIGNSRRVKVKKGWNENAVVYVALVSPAGTIKTHPVKFALIPIIKKDSAAFKDYQNDMKQYKEDKSKHKGNNSSEHAPESEVPIFGKYIMKDFTPEALVKQHSFNMRSLGVHSDEFIGWFNSFDRYNKGNAMQTWLSIWSMDSISVDRKGSESLYIEYPHISVIGGIQNDVLKKLSKDILDNGMLDRILWVYRADLKRDPFNDIELDEDIIGAWQEIIENILDEPMRPDSNAAPFEMLNFNSDAKKLYIQHINELRELANESDNEQLKGTLAKLETYTARFSLILEMMKFGCKESTGKSITIESVQGAIKLEGYFRQSALKVHKAITSEKSFENIGDNKRDTYNSLPNEFTTGEGLKVAELIGMPERTFKDWLKETELFQKLEHGKYKKIHEKI
jgi:hypothetical protein